MTEQNKPTVPKLLKCDLDQPSPHPEFPEWIELNVRQFLDGIADKADAGAPEAEGLLAFARSPTPAVQQIWKEVARESAENLVRGQLWLCDQILDSYPHPELNYVEANEAAEWRRDLETALKRVETLLHRRPANLAQLIPAARNRLLESARVEPDRLRRDADEIARSMLFRVSSRASHSVNHLLAAVQDPGIEYDPLQFTERVNDDAAWRRFFFRSLAEKFITRFGDAKPNWIATIASAAFDAEISSRDVKRYLPD